MSTLLKMQKFHPLCSRCIGMYPLQNRWTVLRYLQCYENFSECCTHLILPETALFSPTPTFAKEPFYFTIVEYRAIIRATTFKVIIVRFHWPCAADGHCAIGVQCPSQTIIFVQADYDFACIYAEIIVCQRRVAFQKHLGQSSTAIKRIRSDACDTTWNFNVC